MQTLQEMVLLTIGYEGRTAGELVAVLADAGVDVLVDVRLTPLSRKPGFSKRQLADALAAAGVEYLHLPALGNPRDNREAFRRGDPCSRARFRASLRTPRARAALGELRSRVREKRVALLCFEREPDCCHRQLVSDDLLRHDPGLGVWHL
jgi:uncharacterized protein (DUF488 family)